MSGTARHDDDGFTLIELMVVVLIIAILLAIAIPTFLGARERASNRAAQSDIRNTLSAEKVFYTDFEEYTSGVTGVAALKSIEPSLTYTIAAGSKTEIGVQTTGDSGAVCIEKIAGTGTTFSLIDVGQGTGAGTYYASTACPAGFAGGATPTGIPAGYTKKAW